MYKKYISQIQELEKMQTMEQLYISEIKDIVAHALLEMKDKAKIYTYLLLQGIGMTMIASDKLAETEYVYEAVEKYKKMNPFIADSNTMQADKENVSRFDCLADSALELVSSIPVGIEKEDLQIQSLMSLLLESYQQETQVMKKRMEIYDSHLLEQSEQLREKKSERISSCKWMLPMEEKEKWISFICKKNRILTKMWTCKRKVELYNQTEAAYKNRIIGKRRSRQIVAEAEELKKQQQVMLDELTPELDAVNDEILQMSFIH